MKTVLRQTPESYRSILTMVRDAPTIVSVARFLKVHDGTLYAYLHHTKKIFPEIHEKVLGTPPVFKTKTTSKSIVKKKEQVETKPFEFFPKTFLNNSEKVVLHLVKNEEISLENIVICYVNNVRHQYNDAYVFYDIFQEFENNSKLFRRKILPGIKNWWDRNLGQLTRKGMI